MPTQESRSSAPIIKIIAIIAVFVIGLWFLNGATGHNDNHNWQILQYPNGATRVVSDGGYYMRWFGTVWTYPKYIQLDYTDIQQDGVGVTFNDGGSAIMASMIRIETPTTDKDRMTFHQQLPDRDGGHVAVRNAVKAHMINCLRSTGPLMSSSEYQSARKAEYAQVVQEQVTQGLFEMKRVERILKDSTDTKGNPITVYATEVILNNKGLPVISQVSPLHELGIEIKQFSIVNTTFDEPTMKQFATKKEAFQAAENSKAQREKEVQQRLMVVEKGLREKAEIESAANQRLATATIQANQDKLVAETQANQEKAVAETNAAKLVAVALETKRAAETRADQEKAVAEIEAARIVSVALQTKKAAETSAQQELEVSKLRRMAAEEDAKKEIILADAKKQSLALGGAISEHDRVLAEINAKRDVDVSANLAKIQSPTVVMNGGGSGDGKNEGGIDARLVNLSLLKSAGLLDPKK